MLGQSTSPMIPSRLSILFTASLSMAQAPRCSLLALTTPCNNST
ncbi:hypothetical protein FOPG_19545 [Fusarium oxysporum f. sp. conglutinans race 2 54008]|uniref:Uncharacterized protein n=1 Tax=Fusarium oxysporum f. sp. conglutinans race 2 54008 TaxID=1089457 RepID=X0GWI2_FUSOX|nr:hypothetical protein FOPG_19545 [Fusarium oxysporum f. sp. conglutinans race 2 54008]